MAGFGSETALLALLAIPAMYVLYARILSRRKRDAIRFGSLAFVKSAMGDRRRSRRHSLVFLLSMAVAGLMILGFADPRIELEQSREGVTVVLVIDVSGSMQAQDYPPSRLEAAKGSARILLESLHAQDHVGIVTFETGATTAAYLSPHKDRVIEKLAVISPREGKTAIGDGLSLGIDMATSIPNKKKVVILLSDGVNNAGVITPSEAVAFAQSSDIQVHAIGLGSEGRIVLGYDLYGQPQYAELDEETLRAIAQQTGGQYFKSVDVETLDEIYENIGRDIKREKEETSIAEWFFAAALAVFGSQTYLRYGRGRVIQ